MSALAEFALAEIGDAELALDSLWYADIAAASSPLFTASASGGRVVYASASASLGVAEQDHVSRVVTQPATADAAFSASTGGQLIANIDPKQNWVWTPAADGSRALLSGGAASLSFTADAMPVNDETFGVATWSWSSQAVGQAFAHGVGSATLVFPGAPVMQSVSNTVGVAALSWSGGGSAGQAQIRTGYADWSWASMAPGQMMRWIDSAASWGFATAGVLQARRSAVGSSALSWAHQGRADIKTVLPAQGDGVARFTSAAAGGAAAGINASAPISFMATARVSAVQSSQGLATLLFEALAKPGGAIFTSLPRAREGFVVPAAQEAWRVAPDPELEDV